MRQFPSCIYVVQGPESILVMTCIQVNECGSMVHMTILQHVCTAQATHNAPGHFVLVHLVKFGSPGGDHWNR